jgi:hypothetical protein
MRSFFVDVVCKNHALLRVATSSNSRVGVGVTHVTFDPDPVW